MWYENENLTLVKEIKREVAISCSFWLSVILYLTFLT
jgi:hypothetical protein